MAVVHPSIFLAMKQFPDRKNLILEQYRANKTFQSICEDYQTCIEALTRWNDIDSDEAAVRRQEYQDLIRSLEFEITEYLSKFACKS